jgi:hypothetical protein
MSGARSTKATDYTTEPGAHCTTAKAVDCRSEPGTDCMSAQAADCKSATARNRDCPGTTAYCGSSATEARRNGRHSSSSDDYHCYSAPNYAGRSCSHRNHGQPIGDGRYHEACDRAAGAGSRDDLIPRNLPARGHDPLHCPALPTCASCSRAPVAEYCPSLNQACVASSPLRRAGGFARDPAAAESFHLHRETSPGVRYSQSRCVPENQGQQGDRPSRRRLADD